RTDRQQGTQRTACLIHISELAVHDRESYLRRPQSGHVDFERMLQRALAVVLAVSVDHQRQPVPSRMIGVELRGAFRQRATAFPVPGIGEVQPKKSRGVSLHAVQSQGTLGRSSKLAQFSTEEMG